MSTFSSYYRGNPQTALKIDDSVDLVKVSGLFSKNLLKI